MAGRGDCAGLTADLISSFLVAEQPASVEGLIFYARIPALPVPASELTP